MTDIVTVSIVVVFAAFSAANSNSPRSFYPPSRPKNESTKGFYNLSQHVTYPEKTRRGGEESFFYDTYRDNSKIRSLTKRSEDGDCPSFFTRDSIHKNCLIPCSPENCINGKCEGVTECKCNDGYIKSQTNSFICHPKCRPCQPGECNESQLCTCDEGYRLSSNQRTCEPICNEKRCNGKVCIDPEICKEDPTKNNVTYGQFCNAKCEFGECVGPNTCKCFNGNHKIKYGQCSVFHCKKNCGFGTCVVPHTCKCFDGFKKNKNGQCTRPTCKPECEFATCIGPNYCKCLPGYEKPFKNATTCNPVCKRCDKGTCVGPETCRCNHGFGNPKSDKGTCVACKSKCEHGTCSNNRCDCSPGWTGESCEKLTMCFIALQIPDNSDKWTRELSESYGTDDVATNFHVDTELQACHDKCFNELKIRNIANFSLTTSNMIYYFVPITSACNKMEPNDKNPSQKSTIIIVLIITSIILFATIFGVVTFMLWRQRNGRFKEDVPLYDDAGAVHLYEPLERKYCTFF